MKNTTFKIEGMHCTGCAQTIQALLHGNAGVRKAAAAFDTREARVLYDPAAVSEDQLAAAIEKAGFRNRRLAPVPSVASQPGRRRPRLSLRSSRSQSRSFGQGPQRGGIADPNSGGTTLFITPGLQYVTRKWIVETGVQIPVSQRLNGTALKNDYVFTAGFRINF